MIDSGEPKHFPIFLFLNLSVETFNGYEYWQHTVDDFCNCPGLSGALTGDGGSISQRIHNNKAVLQAPPSDPLGSDQNQRFPSKRGHPGHFLIDLQLITVKLCSRQCTH